MEEGQGFSLCADSGGKLHSALLYVSTLGSAEMREKLLRWAEEKFGEVSIEDVFNMKEEVLPDKQNRRIRQITMFLKKRKGIREEWLRADVFRQWVADLKGIVGENLKMQIFSSEGNELRYAGGVIKEADKKEEYAEMEKHLYNYQFNLVIWKKL